MVPRPGGFGSRFSSKIRAEGVCVDDIPHDYTECMDIHDLVGCDASGRVFYMGSVCERLVESSIFVR